MNTLARAIAFAAEAHKDQTDKCGKPYILHPIRVMLAVLAKNLPETYAVVAVLHDVVEDCGVTLDEIEEAFGPIVRRGVDAMTRRGHFEDEEWVWDETHREYALRCLKDSIGLEVKECDTHDNMDPKRFCDGVPIKRYVLVLEMIASRREYLRKGGHAHGQDGWGTEFFILAR